jgi:hypothetical protein
MRSARVSLTCVALLLATAGCGGKAGVNQASAPPCETRVPATHPADTLTVVVFDKIDLSHAPWPQNRSERFVFSHLYETLVKIDCHGRVQPGIAKSWKEASDGWYIEIKEDAHFWDDTMVTAADVQATLRMASHLGIERADIVDETHVIIHGKFDITSLALPMLAIGKQSELGTVPIGTGPWQIGGAGSDKVIIRPLSVDAPVVIFQHEDAADAMDMLTGSAHAMITDDPVVIDYARTKAAATLSPLPWDKAYVLIDPARVTMVATSRSVTDLPRTVCDALARDVVPVDSRGGSDILIDASKASSIIVGYRSTLGSAASKDILYDAADPTARALAERIVALVAMDTTVSVDARAVRRSVPGAVTGTRALGLPSDEFARRLYSGDAICVASLSWNANFPFLALHFHAVAPWLDGRGELSRALIPLVETRAHFITLSDRIGYSLDKMGNVRILGPGVERVQ